MLTLKPTMNRYNPALGNRLKDFIRYSEVQQLVYKILDLQRQRREDFRSLAVVSLLPGEGKTLFTAVLALAYADASGARTLAVDTTTFHHPKSLSLRQCIDPDNPLVEFTSLKEYRDEANNRKAGRADVQTGRSPVASPEAARGGDLALPPTTDHSLIRVLAENQSKRYGLVILDTESMTARNKNNLDPQLVARLSDASVLVSGRKSLNGPDVAAHLRLLEDPALHLIGVVSNEEVSQ